MSITYNVNEDGDVVGEDDGGDGGGPPAKAAAAAGDGGDDLRAIIQTLLLRVEQLESGEKEIREHLFPQDPAGDVPDGTLFYVSLPSNTGSDGTKTSTPSYTYVGVVAGTTYSGLIPAVRIWGAGRFTPATKGIGYKMGGSLTLLLALEGKRTVGC